LAELKQRREFTVTNRLVLSLAIPTTLAYLSTPLIGIVDTGVVGQLGDAALLGGLAIGAVLFDILFSSFNFLRASTVALVAQALGEGEEERQKVVLLRALLLSATIGLVALALGPLVLRLGLWAMDASGAVASAVAIYFGIRILCAPVTLVNYAILGWALGLGRGGLGLFLQTVLNGTNIALSIYMGLSLGWGLAGVAWATVIAEALAALVGLSIAWWSTRQYDWPNVARIFDRVALLQLFAVNRDIMIRTFCLLFSFAFFTAQSARFGEATLAANAVLMHFFLLSGYFLDGFATAAEQLAGRAVGARYRPAFDRTVKLTLLWGLVLAGCATTIYLLTGPVVINILTTAPEVRKIAHIYLPWAAVTALAGLVAFQMDGVFIGATWSSDMRNMMLLSVVIYLLVWWFAVPVLGNHGLWLALNVFLAVRGITLYARLPARRRQSFG
jgi:putative MATE family efflux protein